MKKTKSEYTLKPVKSSELPTRGKWKFRASDIVEQFDFMPEKYVEVQNIKSKKELQALYDALKALIKRNNLSVEVSTKEGRLFLAKDMRYFVK